MPSDNKSLSQVAKENPTQIGDPVSLKAETSNTEPTNDDRPAKGTEGRKTLKEVAKENPTQLGDPVSLKAETSNTEPTDDDRGALGKGGKSGQAGKPKL